jgi:MoxR-like ATPase
MAGPVLRHRIVPSFTAEAEGLTAIEIVEQLVAASA